MIRKPESEDGKDFSSLINSQGGQPLFRALFGAYNYTNLIENSYLSFIVHSDEGDCIGFAAFDDINNITKEFDNSLETLNDILPCNATNSIFLHFIAVDDFKQPPGKDIGKELLTKAFEKLTDVDYIFLVVPESARLSETLTKLLPSLDVTKRKQIPNSDPLKGIKVHCAVRNNYFPKLLVRNALVEDHDDLLPIIKAQNPTSAQETDEFFLAADKYIS